MNIGKIILVLLYSVDMLLLLERGVRRFAGIFYILVRYHGQFRCGTISPS